MSEMMVTLPNAGVTLPMTQVQVLGRLIQQHGHDTHWHQNECRCCVTLHTPEGAYIIDSGGEYTFYSGQHCGCSSEVRGFTT